MMRPPGATGGLGEAGVPGPADVPPSTRPVAGLAGQQLSPTRLRMPSSKTNPEDLGHVNNPQRERGHRQLQSLHIRTPMVLRNQLLKMKDHWAKLTWRSGALTSSTRFRSCRWPSSVMQPWATSGKLPWDGKSELAAGIEESMVVHDFMTGRPSAGHRDSAGATSWRIVMDPARRDEPAGGGGVFINGEPHAGATKSPADVDEDHHARCRLVGDRWAGWRARRRRRRSGHPGLPVVSL